MDDIYTKNAEIMNALSTPIRLQIMDMLSCGELCASVIQESFSITQPTLSYHMKILTSAGVVSMRNEGKYVFYSLKMEKLKIFLNEIEQIITLKEECVCHSIMENNCREQY